MVIHKITTDLYIEKLTTDSIIARLRSVGDTTLGPTLTRRIQSLFDNIRHRYSAPLEAFRSIVMRSPRLVPALSQVIHNGVKTLLKAKHEEDGFLLGKDHYGFFKCTDELEDLPPLQTIIPALYSSFRIKSNIALPYLTFSTESYSAPEIKIAHLPACESAEKLQFNDYTIHLVSRRLLAAFLKQKRNSKLRSHMTDWAADQMTPPNHKPKFTVHELKILPKKIRARIQRIYLRNLSIGYYHRHSFPHSNHCHFCTQPNNHQETLHHLFHDCKTAALVWKKVRDMLWPPALHHTFPSDAFTHISGDESHLAVPPTNTTAWRIIHALTVSSIYIQRCKMVFNPILPLPPERVITGHIVSRVISSLADSIRASWSATKANFSAKGRSKFIKIWQSDLDDFYVSLTPVEHEAENCDDAEAPERYTYRLAARLRPHAS